MGRSTEPAKEWTRTAKAQHPWHVWAKAKMQNGHGRSFCNFLPRDTKFFISVKCLAFNIVASFMLVTILDVIMDINTKQ
ncbi:MAG: hypothetical protein VSS75_017115 [Candidatus Parabeggiatoa sp.]|nr:hypothetical protein [Candidatus Parabeggiatoa sp.]